MTTNTRHSLILGSPLNSREMLVRFLLLVLIITAAVTMTGCSFTVHEPKEAGMRRSTVGQELIDLKRAYETGAINDQEYEDKRQELLGSRR
ncbi:MAG: SHOCT domain-containing protein [Limisphaerales bacterium]